MPAADLLIAAPAQALPEGPRLPDVPFTEAYSKEIAAAVTVVVAFVIARVVDRAFARRGHKVAAGVAGGELSPVADTRLRLVRRLVTAAILVVGFALAFSQFDPVRRAATGVLASSALLGVVLGFAARQTLANAMAGILLAITQPIRIGDLVTFEEETGTVEDVRLAYTYIRSGDGRRIIVPNERLAQSTIENHTIVDPRVHIEVSLWIPPGADATRALAVLAEEEGVEAVEVAEVEKEGIRLVARTWAETATKRGPVEAGLRARCLERLRNERISFDRAVPEAIPDLRPSSGGAAAG